jgi:glycosyltransferase involved in cell wall biosynthesis
MRLRKPGALRKISKHGFGTMAIYWSHKFFPHAFNLLKEQALPASIRQSVEVMQQELMHHKIYDYWDWSDIAKYEKSPTHKVGGYIWFLPCWSNVWGGGHYTIFRFANQMCHRAGQDGYLFVYDHTDKHPPISVQQEELNQAVPECRLKIISNPADLPHARAGIATTWQSAYYLRSFPYCDHKFYFMQDYESQFYAYGTSSMQANNTYTFGFSGITGGPWLKKCYESHGGAAINYRFAADLSIFYPADSSGTVRDRVKRVFFYGRPSTERRCFDLGMAALHKIALEFPEVEIVIAGLDLASPPPFKATLLGNMPLAATGELYRTCDVGIAFSATNLSYLPIELMATGVPVLSNNGPHVEWHCRHGENAWVVDPTPVAVLEGFRELYNSREKRQKIATGGIKTMAQIDWEEEIDRLYHYTVACIVDGQAKAASAAARPEI